MGIQHLASRRGENFPVASRLLTPQQRVLLLAFYDFARGADELADAPNIPPAERHAALASLRKSMVDKARNTIPPWALPYYRATHTGLLSLTHGDRLLGAFLRDQEKTRYESWAELVDYCDLSAAPVGRAFLQICNEPLVDLDKSDALCTALQVLNHVQDCGADYQTLDRVYLPQAWLRDVGADDSMLSRPQCSLALRLVLDRTLKACRELLEQAEGIQVPIANRRTRITIAFIYEIACSLTRKLEQHDPLAQKVTLNKKEYAVCMLRALWRR